MKVREDRGDEGESWQGEDTVVGERGRRLQGAHESLKPLRACPRSSCITLTQTRKGDGRGDGLEGPKPLMTIWNKPERSCATFLRGGGGKKRSKHTRVKQRGRREKTREKRRAETERELKRSGKRWEGWRWSGKEKAGGKAEALSASRWLRGRQ